ncbi:MAG: 4-hydroxy-tetrahydrodipicolinate reductase [Oscillospiraceae bacterium]|nr:4-hydroxy-tetrahydrodipicolinate reductase [Oscillospiraceae bacterium]
MLKLMIIGIGGAMGQSVARAALADSEITLAAGIDISADTRAECPVFLDPLEYSGSVDVVIDFSSPKALPPILRYCTTKKVPLVMATTGHSEEQLALLRELSQEVPVFITGNLSLGINLLVHLANAAAKVLFPGGKFDAEILEAHHRRKVDAPSKTALMLRDAVASGYAEVTGEEPQSVYSRESRRIARPAAEIGISSIRGGTIVGEHEVIFAGTDEVIKLSHSATSRDVFAEGAVRAARFLAGKAPGMYGMQELLSDIL